MKQWFSDLFASLTIGGLLTVIIMAIMQSQWWYLFGFISLFIFLKVITDRINKKNELKKYLNKLK